QRGHLRVLFSAQHQLRLGSSNRHRHPSLNGIDAFYASKIYASYLRDTILGKSSDPELEEQIINDVGSYGRQLGQIGDALRVLAAHVKLEDLKPEEERALKALQYQ